MATKKTYAIKQLEPTDYDVRLIERQLSDGRITNESLEAHIKGLPDLTRQSVTFEIAIGDDPPKYARG